MKEFKLIVAGSRGFKDYLTLESTLLDLAKGLYANQALSIVSGMAKGADSLAVRFAKEHGVQLYERPANWDKYGKAAGYRRNTEMGNFADGLLVFWDGESRGTKHMIDYMESLGKPVFLVRY